MSDTHTGQQDPCLSATSSQEQPTSEQGDLPMLSQPTAPTSTESVNETIPNQNLLVVSPTNPSLSSSRLISSPIRVPGTFPPEWLPDHETDTCMACETQFTLIKRRHHCRSCGKIFCSECCKQRARLLYMNNREARVCNNCHNLIESTLCIPGSSEPMPPLHDLDHQQPQSSSSIDQSRLSSFEEPTASTSSSNVPRPGTSAILRVQSVLKNRNQSRPSGALGDGCNISNSSSSDQHSNKQVIFSDGIRPGTDLSEPFPNMNSRSSLTDRPSNASFSLASRQNRITDAPPSSSAPARTAPPASEIATSHIISSNDNPKKNRSSRSSGNITVCDELGYLPPIVISKSLSLSNLAAIESSSAPSSLASIIVNQFKSSKKSIETSMQSRSCFLNGVIKFEEISGLVGVENVITFLLLKSFYLKAKIVTKLCCVDRSWPQTSDDDSKQPLCLNLSDELNAQEQRAHRDCQKSPEYWCFISSGLDKLGQEEIMFVLDKDKDNSCIPRDIFKIYLTLHELALRRQAIENLGNLLFQDGLFGSRDTAGLLFVQPSSNHCFQNLIPTDNKFLIALVLQRWEVPWSKVFPMRLLLRLGHKYDAYPYPIVSYRSREPVYYEIGHTIISILADFRNFRYSLTHVDGLKVMLNKTSRKVVVQLHHSNYMQFSKVLDSSNNEHVLAWSAGPFSESDGHLVSVQTDEGQYETVEFYKCPRDDNISFTNLETGPVLGASFIVFSGALKVNQSGQPAKISVVEDGLLVQIQSCTMSALRNAVHYMENFDIDCGNAQDAWNRLEIRWQSKEFSLSD